MRHRDDARSDCNVSIHIDIPFRTESMPSRGGRSQIRRKSSAKPDRRCHTRFKTCPSEADELRTGQRSMLLSIPGPAPSLNDDTALTGRKLFCFSRPMPSRFDQGSQMGMRCRARAPTIGWKFLWILSGRHSLSQTSRGRLLRGYSTTLEPFDTLLSIELRPQRPQ